MTPADGYIEDPLEWSYKNGAPGTEYSADGNTRGGLGGGLTLIASHTTHRRSKRWRTSTSISLTADTSLSKSGVWGSGGGDSESKRKLHQGGPNFSLLPAVVGIREEGNQITNSREYPPLLYV